MRLAKEQDAAFRTRTARSSGKVEPGRFSSSIGSQRFARNGTRTVTGAASQVAEALVWKLSAESLSKRKERGRTLVRNSESVAVAVADCQQLSGPPRAISAR